MQTSVHIPESNKPRIVILGAGFGGLRLIQHINTNDYQVVLLDRYNYHTFQPLLYQVATAGLEPDSVAGPLRKLVKTKKIHYRMLNAGTINPHRKEIETPEGNLAYDYLVIATGARVNFFGIESIQKNALPLKQITHALDIRSHIFQQLEKAVVTNDPAERERLMTFVVVGAGPTGVEMCGALAELKNHVLPKDYPELDIGKLKIYLVEGLKQVLPMMSEKSGNKAHKYLQNMGVEVVLETLTDKYNGKTVYLNNDTQIESETLIWAAGVKGNILQGLDEKSDKKGKYLVNKHNQVFKDPEAEKAYDDVFAIGDVAYLTQEDYPNGLPGVAQVAIQQGKTLANNFKLLAKQKPMKPFHYKNKGDLATIGRNKAVADLPNTKISGFAGWFIWAAVHLMYLVGFRNRVVVFANWFWNYTTYDRSIRLILRPSTKKDDVVSQQIEKSMQEA